ncbi:hypothetical protein BDF20DRAFT_884698 [Mycotypha africana]|uniref:uncharacterized protein n=1 Tax=Mycotypha africana TaxID=64632 RepID=UPI0022FFCF26|nr:uncharacterized protein BDF20DRAFT_884698 [Mycotypha africana]KAI8971478.1 hypothetical protein BDF20DRAFT_884698 [Mycotypha africana]
MKTQIKTMHIVPNASNQDINRCVQKWKADKYSETPRRVPLIVFGAGMFGKDVVLSVNFLQL